MLGNGIHTLSSVSAMLILLLAPLTHAADWYVSASCTQPELGTQTQPFCDIQTALDLAEHVTDTIWVEPGTYAGPLEFPGKAVRLVSTHGPASTQIVGIPDQPVVSLPFDPPDASELEITGFTVRGGKGGLYATGWVNMLVQDCIITDNEADSGAGVLITRGYGVFLNCTIAGNRAVNHGGGVLIESESEANLVSCLIEDNKAASGAGIYAAGSTTLDHCIVRGNQATGAGGGLTCTNNQTMVVMYSTTVCNNKAKAGAGIDFDQARGLLFGVIVEGNIAEESGGGLKIKESNPLQLFGCTIQGNRAELFNGGGMTVSGGSYSYFEDCVISGNFARNGGGVYSYDFANPRFNGCIIEDNVAEKLNGIHGYAGGLALGEVNEFTSGPLLSRCIIRRNRADAAGGIGHSGIAGGVVNCVIEDNQAQSVGGGILCNNGSLKVVSSLLQGNSAGYGGGAFYAYNEGHFRIVHCTVVFNGADYGAGLYAGSDSHPEVINSIFWRDADEFEVEPDSTVAATYSTIAGNWPGEGNSGLDPQFDPEGSFRLRAGSEAINSAVLLEDGPILDYDLDGHARVLCKLPDRGAYEFGFGDLDCDQVLELAEFYQFELCMLGPQLSGWPGCEPFDFAGDLRVDLKDLAVWFNLFTSP